MMDDAPPPRILTSGAEHGLGKHVELGWSLQHERCDRAGDWVQAWLSLQGTSTRGTVRWTDPAAARAGVGRAVEPWVGGLGESPAVCGD